MNKKRRIYLFVAVALTALVIGSLALRHLQTPSGADVVKVAVNMPLTGPYAPYTQPLRNGLETALDELKDRNAVPKMSFDIQDNGGSTQTAVTIMQKQFVSRPDVYASGAQPQTMAIEKQVSAYGTPHFVWIFDMFINKNSSNNLRILPNYRIEAGLLIEYAKRRRPHRVAIASWNLAHAEEEYRTAVIPGLVRMGIQSEDILFEAYDVSTKDFKSIAVKIHEFKPDLIILSGLYNHLSGLIRSLRPLGAISPGNTIGSLDMVEMNKYLQPAELEGIRAIAPIIVSRPDVTKEFADWTKRYEKRFGEVPHYLSAYAYDMTMVIYDAGKRLKLPASPAQWLSALKETNIGGVTGPIKFRADGDADVPCEVAVFRDGKIIPDKE
ncbi:MAG: ABC transporter substrate-binding protein [Thermodesulfobacteriota bacterium]